VREVERCLVRARLDRKGHVERVAEQRDNTRESAAAAVARQAYDG
jgi:hypothetical protein